MTAVESVRRVLKRRIKPLTALSYEEVVMVPDIKI